ncbi:hypothetical protein OIDMADRAFT_183718 [Oidiodendron maius Zn]|uniref:Nephrocystin 3-like N-terminal domain-containing protein n=1 Tax=Oidiodendron maius (strain Zn) TaxID=913774 RepID=A0A0C3GWU2_OIDMZ|nr:hypothetical protein OIDMADRAFT_183718 [Oidiodendron maius Zn]
MATPADPPVGITNAGGKVAIQAVNYNAHGETVVNVGRDEDLLTRLPYAAEAPFNSYAKQHEPTCLPDTNVDLLQTIYNWADGQDERCIFWLNGLAGTGKSTIARTVARKYFDE